MPTTLLVTQSFKSVKSSVTALPSSDSTSHSVIHHKTYPYTLPIILRLRKGNRGKPYGVSLASRVLSPQLLLKRFDQVRDCLQDVLGLTTSQREITLKLLRLWAYYGQVYPKAVQVAEQPGSSSATFWRTIKLLGEQNLVQVINRFLIRPHAQISNLYRFDKLIILIARYLAEHGHVFYEEWLKPYLSMPGSCFWPWTFRVNHPLPSLGARGN